MALNKEIERLFKNNYASLHRLAAIMLHDSETAHDVVHDVFMTLLHRGDIVELDRGYLAMSVRNRCLNLLRDMDVRERFRNLYLLETDEEETPDNRAYEEMMETLRNCEQSLSPQCLRIFRMRFHEGLSAGEISARLRIGERAVFKQLRHAIDIIRLKLNQNG